MAGGNSFREDLFSGETLEASGTAYSHVINLDNYQIGGYMGFFVEVTGGSGQIKLEGLASYDGLTFMKMSTEPFLENFGASSGPDSDGKQAVSYAPVPCPYFKVLVTEDGGANSVTFNLSLVVT